MFGVLTPCRHLLDDELMQQWRAHLCGLCVSLRDNHGQHTRATTNTDAVMISILTAAQSPATQPTSEVGRCPLRGMRTATVVSAYAPGVRLATTTSLTLAAAKALDVTEEQRLGLAPRSRLRAAAATTVARRLAGHAATDTEVADVLGIDSLLDGLSAQASTERTSRDLTALTHAPAAAAAEVFAASATLAGAEDNREHLALIGYDYGRIAHLLDAVDDLAEDTRTGTFNPLTATGTDTATALADCRRLAAAIRTRYSQLTLFDDRLLRRLLVDGLRATIHDRAHAESADAHRHSTDRAQTADPDTPLPPQPPLPPQTPFPPNRRFHERLLPFIGVSCSGIACCAEHWNHCDDQRKPPLCEGCDCCSCGDCCDCCDCCEGGCCSCCDF